MDGHEAGAGNLRRGARERRKAKKVIEAMKAGIISGQQSKH
jgi:hypothetical protein